MKLTYNPESNKYVLASWKGCETYFDTAQEAFNWIAEHIAQKPIDVNINFALNTKHDY